MTKQEKVKVNMERYYFYKSHGICVKCGQQEALLNHVHCADCIYKINESANKKSQNPEVMNRRREIRKKCRSKKIENGICYSCSEPVYQGYRKCKKCLQKDRMHSKIRYDQKEKSFKTEKKYDNRLCFWCGNPVKNYDVRKSKQFCEACKLKMRESIMKNRIWEKSDLRNRS